MFKYSMNLQIIQLDNVFQLIKPFQGISMVKMVKWMDDTGFYVEINSKRIKARFIYIINRKHVYKNLGGYCGI